MTTKPISHNWQCTGCGRVEEIYRQDTFVHLCCTLLSGKPVKVVCSGCGEAVEVREVQIRGTVRPSVTQRRGGQGKKPLVRRT